MKGKVPWNRTLAVTPVALLELVLVTGNCNIISKVVLPPEAVPLLVPHAIKILVSLLKIGQRMKENWGEI